VGLPITASVQLAGSVFTGTRSAGAMPITATLSRVMPLTVTVLYSTTDGTALAGQDYIAANGVLTFAPGLTQAAITVTVLPAEYGVPGKVFSVALSGPVSATLGAPNTATVTILNGAAPPSVHLSSSHYSVSESGGSAVITATLSAASALTATVHYSTSDGTALAGSDYLASSGVLTFTPGLTQTLFSVPIISDTLHEADETFGVALAGPAGANLGAPAAATVTIYDDDPAPGVSFSSAAYTVTETDGAAVITVTLSAASGLTATVHVATADGSAAAGSDYSPVSRTLTFAPGQVQQVLTVPITNDTQVEGSETVTLTLSSPVEAVLDAHSTATLVILDDGVDFRLYLPAVFRP
jgi:hypothetical protein